MTTNTRDTVSSVSQVQVLTQAIGVLRREVAELRQLVDVQAECIAAVREGMELDKAIEERERA
jgi:hypothetical protein